MAATIKDVARQAKVSIASVSRALNGTGSVTPETRERVLRVARSLKYTPHIGARSLITRRTNTIGVLLPDIHGEFFSELIRGIDRAARARGMHLLVSSSHGDAKEAESVLSSMNSRVDGLLLMSPHVDANFLDDSLPSGVPTVLMNTRDESGARSAFMVDNYGGAFEMTGHLLDAGYRSIAHVTGPKCNFESQERLRGYRAALAQSSLGEGAIEIDGDFSEECGYRAGRSILEMAERPRAVFAGNDMTAIGCLHALTEAGLRVPQDIALAGFDDIPIARFVTPALTTLRVNIDEMGRRAFERLINSIGKSAAASAPSQETLQPQLIVRASSGGAKSAKLP